MSNYKKPLLVSAMVTILCMVIVFSLVYATQIETMTVNAGAESVFTINLNEGDKFSGSISVSGGSGNDIDFRVTDPNGNTIVNSGRVSQGRTFDFTAQKNGAYSLHFDNSFSVLSSKFVSLSYDIERDILSNPIFSLLIILVVIIVGLLLVWIGIRRTRKKPNTPTP